MNKISVYNNSLTLKPTGLFRPMNGNSLPLLAVCIGQTVWGFSFIFSKMAMQWASPAIVLSIRFNIAFIMMSILLISGKFHFSLKGKKVRSLVTLGGMEVLYFYVESQGILHTNATYSGIALAVVPVISIIMAALFLKEYPTKKQAAFSFLPVAGVIIAAVSGSSLGIVTPVGAFFLAATCLISSVYRIINRKAAVEFTSFERTYAAIFMCSLAYTISAFKSVGWSFAEYMAPVSTPGFIIPVLILSLFCSVICNLLVNYAAGKLPVAAMSAFGTLTTLFSMLAGALFLGEPFTAAMLVGSVLIIVGIWEVTKA